MKDKKIIDKAFFEVEADLNADPDKIYKTITKSKNNWIILDGLTLTEFSLKEKKDICLYSAYYELTEENLSALDTLKNNNKEISLFKIRNLNNLNIFGSLLEELVKKVKNEKHVKYRRNYTEYSKFNFIKAIGADGLELIDNYSNEKTDKVIGFMLKTLGKNFLSGKNLTQISLPIYINDDRTFLEM